MPGRKKNDALLKAAFEEHFISLLHFFYEEVDTLFDLNRGFTFMDKELNEIYPEREQKGGNRTADLLVKLFLTQGQPQYILLHTEIQGSDDKDFAFRMFQYYYRLIDRFRMNITMLVVFTGKQQQRRPSLYHAELLGTTVSFRYRTYHIFDHSEAELIAMDTPFSLVILAAQKEAMSDKIPESELNKERLILAKTLITSKKYNKEQIGRFLLFLKCFLNVNDPEINRTFEEDTVKLIGRNNTMGIIETIMELQREEALIEGKQEGMQAGMIEGQRKGMIEQSRNIALAMKQDGMPLEQISRFTALSPEEIQQLH